MSWARMGLVFLHFVQSVLGYLAMFAAMTYSSNYLLPFVLGATTGYARCTWTTRRRHPRTRLPGPGRSECVQAHTYARDRGLLWRRRGRTVRRRIRRVTVRVFAVPRAPRR